MTREETLQLVKKHAPIFWMHENEAFLPEDCGIMVQIADLYRKGTRLPDLTPPRRLDDLGTVPNSDECSLKIRDLDMRAFDLGLAGRNAGITMPGPEGVAELARRNYGRQRESHVPGISPLVPKYYARVTEIDLKRGDRQKYTSRCELLYPEVFGKYAVIEYFFFYVFNDSWNKHQGDWDSMLQIWIRGGKPRYMVTTMHKCRWLCRWPEETTSITEWLKQWGSLKKNALGPVYELNGHPYVFIALGAHGAYPTPGFSVHGAGVPGLNLLADTDERQVGRIGILPEDTSEEFIRTNLRVSGISADQTQFGKWREPELVENQTWRKYKGKWGQESKFQGWTGPQNPPISGDPVRDGLEKSYQEQYDGTGPLSKIFVNWHGI